MSDLSNEQKLEQIYQMTLENNDVLRSIRRQQYMSSFFSIIFWLVILGALGSTYYFVKPFIPSVISNVGKIKDTLNQLNQVQGGFSESRAFNDVMKNFKPQSSSVPAQ